MATVSNVSNTMTDKQFCIMQMGLSNMEPINNTWLSCSPCRQSRVVCDQYLYTTNGGWSQSEASFQIKSFGIRSTDPPTTSILFLFGNCPFTVLV